MIARTPSPHHVLLCVVLCVVNLSSRSATRTRCFCMKVSQTPDYRMPMRIRAILFSFLCLLRIECAAIRATDRLRLPYTQDLFFDKRTLIVVINSTLQHVHPFSALHCAMTAVQCAPHRSTNHLVLGLLALPLEQGAEWYLSLFRIASL